MNNPLPKVVFMGCWLAAAMLPAVADEVPGELQSVLAAQPAEVQDRYAWRLPPSFATSRNDPELRAAMEAVGESNRMTLKFSKPPP